MPDVTERGRASQLLRMVSKEEVLPHGPGRRAMPVLCWSAHPARLFPMVSAASWPICSACSHPALPSMAFTSAQLSTSHPLPPPPTSVETIYFSWRRRGGGWSWPLCGYFPTEHHLPLLPGIGPAQPTFQSIFFQWFRFIQPRVLRTCPIRTSCSSTLDYLVFLLPKVGS